MVYNYFGHSLIKRISLDFVVIKQQEKKNGKRSIENLWSTWPGGIAVCRIGFA